MTEVTVMIKRNLLRNNRTIPAQPSRLSSPICLGLILLILCINTASAQVSLRTDYLRVDIDKAGSLESIYDLANNTEYLAKSQPAVLLTVRLLDFSYQNPTAVTFSENNHLLKFTYGQTGVTAKVRVSQKKTHIIFELVSIEPEQEVSRIIWGPYPTTIKQTIGETIGVVRNDSFAIGIQALNVKTDGSASGKDFGSTLQLRCNNHNWEIGRAHV